MAVSPTSDFDLSFCIVNWNSRDLTAQLLASIYASVRTLSFEIIVVDNASNDGIHELVETRYPDVIFIQSVTNAGYAAGVNQALKIARGRFLMVLNPDVILLPGAVEAMAEFLEANSNVGAVGCMCLTGAREPGLSYGFFPRTWIFWAEALLGKLAQPLLEARPLAAIPVGQQEPFRVELIIGACMLVRKEVLQTVGLMDERFFAFFEETDWCYRMHQYGLKCYLLPEVEVVHLGGKSFETAYVERSVHFYRSLYLYMKKHHGSLQAWLVKVAMAVARRRRALQALVKSRFRLV